VVSPRTFILLLGGDGVKTERQAGKPSLQGSIYCHIRLVQVLLIVFNVTGTVIYYFFIRIFEEEEMYVSVYRTVPI
jgi:hypothetical protein